MTTRSEEFRVALAQINVTVGALEENATRVINVIEQARDDFAADLVVFPELVITGYPPEDILLREELYQRLEVVLERIIQATTGIDAFITHPILSDENLIYNALTHVSNGSAIQSYCKRILPNYGVFDEARYFTPMVNRPIFNVAGVDCGVMICEDGWSAEVAQEAAEEGAQILIQSNASPFRMGKFEERTKISAMRVKETKLPLVSVHMVGGQDTLVFDGHSYVMDAEGEITHELPPFVEQLALVSFESSNGGWVPAQPESMVPRMPEADMYDAVVLALRDYVEKNGFQGVVLGLSGGIDSAVTMAVAVDALGADRVMAVLLPSQYTSDMSNLDAMEMINNMNVMHHVIPIEGPFKAFNDSLADVFKGLPADVTEENMQARCRGTILMALSNKTGRLLLTTGNKSEMAVGYATLYGDMCGGFAPLKDIYKMDVYGLARYRNTISEVIPERIIMRPPSAELRPDQVDQDTLPDYEVLDAILRLYIEEDMDAMSIAAKGFDVELVNDIVSMVKRSEHKRSQGAIGVKMTTRSFDKDWRYPITSHF